MVWSRLVGFAAVLLAVATVSGTAIAAGKADSQRANQRLFEAIRNNDMLGVQVSLAAGADPEAPDRWGVKPIDLAIDKGYYRIAHALAAARQTTRREAPAPSQPVAEKATPPMPAAAGAAPVKAPATGPSYVWPAGVPNPFDPSLPPPRSQLAPADGQDVAIAQ